MQRGCASSACIKTSEVAGSSASATWQTCTATSEVCSTIFDSPALTCYAWRRYERLPGDPGLPPELQRDGEPGPAAGRGGAPRGRRGRAGRRVRAQHLRGDRRGRAQVAPAGAQAGAQQPRGAPGRHRLLRHSGPGRSCRAAQRRAGGGEPAQGPAGRAIAALVGRAGRRAVAAAGARRAAAPAQPHPRLRQGAGWLQQPVHLLHRHRGARPGAQPAHRGDCGRGAAPDGRGLSGGGVDRGAPGRVRQRRVANFSESWQLFAARPRRRHPGPDRPAPPAPQLAGAVGHRAGLLRPVAAERGPAVPPPAPPLASRLRQDAEAHGPPHPHRQLPRLDRRGAGAHPWPGGEHRSHRRLSGRDGRGLRRQPALRGGDGLRSRACLPLLRARGHGGRQLRRPRSAGGAAATGRCAGGRGPTHR